MNVRYDFPADMAQGQVATVFWAPWQKLYSKNEKKKSFIFSTTFLVATWVANVGREADGEVPTVNEEPGCLTGSLKGHPGQRLTKCTLPTPVP